jgi:hypothetical protein
MVFVLIFTDVKIPATADDDVDSVNSDFELEDMQYNENKPYDPNQGNRPSYQVPPKQCHSPPPTPPQYADSKSAW